MKILKRGVFYVMFLTVCITALPQVLDFTAVQATVDFSRTMQDRDGFGFNHVETVCSSEMEKIQAGISGQAAEKIILDTDMGSDCDDVGALALLHHYADAGQAEILGIIYSSGAVPYGAGIVDAINRYYGREDIPIGACYDEGFGDPVDKMQAKKLASDTVKFRNRIIHNTDAPEQTVLNRRLLASADDLSISYVTIGHTRGLYELLKSPPDDVSALSGEELVRRKIKRWVALGALGAANDEGQLRKDWNFFFNETAEYTQYLVEHFPGPIYFVDGGRTVMTGASLEQTPEENIVRTAYESWLWKAMNPISIKWTLATWNLILKPDADGSTLIPYQISTFCNKEVVKMKPCLII